MPGRSPWLSTAIGRDNGTHLRTTSISATSVLIHSSADHNSAGGGGRRRIVRVRCDEIAFHRRSSISLCATATARSFGRHSPAIPNSLHSDTRSSRLRLVVGIAAHLL